MQNCCNFALFLVNFGICLAFGIFTNYKIKDKWVWLVALLSVSISYSLGQIPAGQIGGYVIGYELLPINGLLTFLGLVLIRR